MSEYLNKQAVLEWLKKEASSGDSDIWNKNFNYGLEYVMENIQSGRFDVTCTQEDPCPECLKESVNGYKIIESELTGEIQRLRAALEELRHLVDDEEGMHIINQALSATTEPTGGERVMDRLDEIKAALAEADFEEMIVYGNGGIGERVVLKVCPEMQVAHVYGDVKNYREKAFVFANAPEWLRFLLSELDRIEREYAEERAAHNAHVTELCELEKKYAAFLEQWEVYQREREKILEEIQTGPEKLCELEKENRKLLEDIERLKGQLEAKLVFINNGWEEERYALQEQAMGMQEKLNQALEALEDIKYQVQQASPEPVLLGIITTVDATLASLKGESP